MRLAFVLSILCSCATICSCKLYDLLEHRLMSFHSPYVHGREFVEPVILRELNYTAVRSILEIKETGMRYISHQCNSVYSSADADDGCPPYPGCSIKARSTVAHRIFGDDTFFCHGVVDATSELAGYYRPRVSKYSIRLFHDTTRLYFDELRDNSYDYLVVVMHGDDYYIVPYDCFYDQLQTVREAARGRIEGSHYVYDSAGSNERRCEESFARDTTRRLCGNLAVDECLLRFMPLFGTCKVGGSCESGDDWSDHIAACENRCIPLGGNTGICPAELRYGGGDIYKDERSHVFYYDFSTFERWNAAKTKHFTLYPCRYERETQQVRLPFTHIQHSFGYSMVHAVGNVFKTVIIDVVYFFWSVISLALLSVLSFVCQFVFGSAWTTLIFAGSVSIILLYCYKRVRKLTSSSVIVIERRRNNNID